MFKNRSLFSFVFALYMLSMVFIPCADACNVNDHDEKITIENAQEHHEEHADLCTPFCSCACCSTQTTFSSFKSIEVLNISLVRKFVVTKQPFHHAIYFSIWQPPKLA